MAKSEYDRITKADAVDEPLLWKLLIHIYWRIRWVATGRLP
jgi:hypothetical protein